ncbi:hypothetical protein ACUNV4_28990 [Granulosicoccus sp. 3-233]|uniref:hypothetical protein n=1 Tax=Granulosicoccus sp. 3-233 TaxID=3417969 RepID=UPI003D3396E9
MAKSKSFAVLTAISSTLALQACSEGINSAEEAIENASAEVTDLPEISIGAANPTNAETTPPATISNYIVNNITLLPSSPPPSITDEETQPDSTPIGAPDVDTPAEIDPEVVTDTPSEIDPEVDTDVPSEAAPEAAPDTLTEIEPEVDTDVPSEAAPEASPDTPTEIDSEVDTDAQTETDPEVPTEPAIETDVDEVLAPPPPKTDSESEADTPPVTDESESASVDYTPVIESPAMGELVPFGSTISFAWSIPATLLGGAVTGFDITMVTSPEGDVFYRNNLVSVSNCSDSGLCTYELDSADVPVPEGDNVWYISSVGEHSGTNLAKSSFTLDVNPVVETTEGLRILSPASDHVADSPSVYFSWEDPSNSDAVYDLHVYSDAARTQKIVGTNGVIFDTAGIRTATSHTFTDDPSDGTTRYGLLVQWPDATYNAEFRKEVLFEYTAYKPSLKTTGRLNNDIAFTNNANDIAKAFEYEDKFYSYLDSIESYVDSVYKNHNEAKLYETGYSGVNGARFYHLYDEMFSLGKVIRLTHIEKPAHYEDYKTLALKTLREHYAIFVGHTGLENAPNRGSSIFYAATDRWRFLDASRALAWMAYLMDSILYADSSYAEEFSGYADRLKTIMEPYLDSGVAPNRNAHMAAHTALAGLMLGRIGGYMAEVQDRVVTSLRDITAAKVDPWDLTDISHAAQSEQAMFYVYESNRRGLSLPELSSIDNSLITALARGAATRMNNSNYSASVSPYTESYGELVKFSSAIASHIALPSEYGNSNRSWITTAHIAYGYAIDSSQ